MQKHRAKNRGTTYIYAKMRLVKLSRAYPTNPTPFRNAAPKWTSLCPPSNALSRRRLLCKWPTKLLSFSSLFKLYIIYHSKKNKSNKKQNKKVKQPQFNISKDKTNCLKTKTKYFNLPNIFVENKTDFNKPTAQIIQNYFKKIREIFLKLKISKAHSPAKE